MDAKETIRFVQAQKALYDNMASDYEERAKQLVGKSIQSSYLLGKSDLAKAASQSLNAILQRLEKTAEV